MDINLKITIDDKFVSALTDFITLLTENAPGKTSEAHAGALSQDSEGENNPDGTKRVRRTKQQIEADKAAKAAGATPVVNMDAPTMTVTGNTFANPAPVNPFETPAADNGFGGGFGAILAGGPVPEAQPKHTVEDLRAAGQKKMQESAANLPKLQALLKEFAVDNVDKLQGVKIDEFLNRINAL